MSKDTIYRQDAIEAVCSEIMGITDYPLTIAYEIAEKVVEDMPSAQPEIIRCKECRYAAPNGVYGCRLERFSCSDDSVRMYGEDFCSMGEQKGKQNE